MKSYSIAIVIVAISFIACRKDPNLVIIQQPVDPNFTLIGTWHIDSTISYSMIFTRSKSMYDRFDTSDINTFYNADSSQLSYENYGFFGPDTIIFTDTSLSQLPIPKPIFTVPKCTWKKKSSNSGFIVTDGSFSISEEYCFIDKDTLNFEIKRTSVNRIILTLDPFLKWWDDDRMCDNLGAGFRGYHCSIYLTKTK